MGLDKIGGFGVWQYLDKEPTWFLHVSVFSVLLHRNSVPAISCVLLFQKSWPSNRASTENGWQFLPMGLNKISFLGRATNTGAGSFGAHQQWLRGGEAEMANGKGRKL